MSITSTLRIAAEAMQIAQRAIQTTGHNIANVSTPGFSRQQVILTSAPPFKAGGLVLGQGVRAEEIRSVVDGFLEGQLLSLNVEVGFTEAKSRAFTGIEGAFPIAEGIGIGAAQEAFFSALSDLANNPAGQVERVSLIGKANALGTALNETRSSLTSLQLNLDKEIGGVVNEINPLLTQIASLNAQITIEQASGQEPNDLIDQRQVLIQRVSRLTGASVFEQTDGRLTMQVNSLVLVSGDRAASLDDSNPDVNGFRTILFNNTAGAGFVATPFFNKGKLGGLLTMRDTGVPDVVASIDQFAKTLVDIVNAQHALGFDLNGTAGGDFFNPIAAVSGAASSVQVSSPVVADPSLIAAAQDAATVPGDNRNALALVNLQTTQNVTLANSTLEDFFLNLLGNIGADSQTSEGTLDFQNSLLSQTQVRRDAISGVNMDEEVIKLIEFQRSFEAASLLVRTVDELFQSVMDMLR